MKSLLNIESPWKLRVEAASLISVFVNAFDAGASLEFFASLAQVNELIFLINQKILRF
jgi:hypothetical protein